MEYKPNILYNLNKATEQLAAQFEDDEYLMIY
jgi:hypothetical protein